MCEGKYVLVCMVGWCVIGYVRWVGRVGGLEDGKIIPVCGWKGKWIGWIVCVTGSVYECGCVFKCVCMCVWSHKKKIKAKQFK